MKTRESRVELVDRIERESDCMVPSNQTRTAVRAKNSKERRSENLGDL